MIRPSVGCVSEKVVRYCVHLPREGSGGEIFRVGSLLEHLGLELIKVE